MTGVAVVKASFLPRPRPLDASLRRDNVVDLVVVVVVLRVVVLRVVVVVVVVVVTVVLNII